jgi:hypothetical protein
MPSYLMESNKRGEQADNKGTESIEGMPGTAIASKNTGRKAITYT